MTIYADILVLTNLYLDFFLLWCVKKFLHLCTRSLRMVFGSLVGAMCALLALVPAPSPVLLLFGVLSALLTAAAAFAPMAPRLFLKAALSFWLFSFLLAGFFLFLVTFFSSSNIAVLGNTVYFDFSPVFLLVSTCAAYLIFTIIERLFPKSASARYCRMTVKNLGSSANLFCKADTGCSLKEPFSGLPVIVAQSDALMELAPSGAILFLSGLPADGKLRLVPFESMGGSGLLPAFRPESVSVSGSEAPIECYIALYGKKLSAGQFNAIYNPDLFPETAGFG